MGTEGFTGVGENSGKISAFCQQFRIVVMLMMLGQENQTKHLNVCLVQHRLEEGSKVV